MSPQLQGPEHLQESPELTIPGAGGTRVRNSHDTAAENRWLLAHAPLFPKDQARSEYTWSFHMMHMNGE